MAFRRIDEGERKKNVGKKGKGERERPVVKKDFPTIYLHLRAVNNSRVRACRAALSKKLCQHDVGLLFRRFLVSSNVLRRGRVTKRCAENEIYFL